MTKEEVLKEIIMQLKNAEVMQTKYICMSVEAIKVCREVLEKEE